MPRYLPFLFVLVASAWIQTVQAAVVTQTVYYIGSIETPTPSTTISPTPANTLLGTTRYSAVGTAENGNTKYDMEVVLSLWVQELRGQLQTLISTPTTRIYTLEENASHLALSASPSSYTTATVQQAGILQNCDIDVPKMKGKCVEVDEVPVGLVTGTDGNLQNRILTLTTTYTAAITPVATFTLTAGSASASTGATGSATSGAGRRSMGSEMLCSALLTACLMASWLILV